MPLPERARARHKGRGRLTVLRKHDMSIVFASMQSGERSELQLCWIARVRAKPRARARARRIRSGENPKSSRSRRIPSSCRTVIDVSAIILFTFNGLRIVILRPLPLIFNKCNLTITQLRRTVFFLSSIIENTSVVVARCRALPIIKTKEISFLAPFAPLRCRYAIKRCKARNG